MSHTQLNEALSNGDPRDYDIKWEIIIKCLKIGISNKLVLV
jgi:hypothetical protein